MNLSFYDIYIYIFEKKLNMKFQMFHLDKISIKHGISNLTFVYNLKWNMFQIKLTSLCIKEEKMFSGKRLRLQLWTKLKPHN